MFYFMPKKIQIRLKNTLQANKAESIEFSEYLKTNRNMWDITFPTGTLPSPTVR